MNLSIHSLIETKRKRDFLVAGLQVYDGMLHTTSVTGQKVETQKQRNQENKAHQFFQKTNISKPLIRTRTCAYHGSDIFGF